MSLKMPGHWVLSRVKVHLLLLVICLLGAVEAGRVTSTANPSHKDKPGKVTQTFTGNESR